MSAYEAQSCSTGVWGTGKEAYDIMEVDTILLGELVKTGKLQSLKVTFLSLKKSIPSQPCRQSTTRMSCMVSQHCSVPLS